MQLKFENMHLEQALPLGNYPWMYRDRMNVRRDGKSTNPRPPGRVQRYQGSRKKSRSHQRPREPLLTCLDCVCPGAVSNNSCIPFLCWQVGGAFWFCFIFCFVKFWVFLNQALFRDEHSCVIKWALFCLEPKSHFLLLFQHRCSF